MRNNTVRVVFLKQLDFLFFESKTNNAFVFCKALWFLGESHIPVTCHTLISLQHHVRVWIFEELPTVYIYAQTGGHDATFNKYHYYSHSLTYSATRACEFSIFGVLTRKMTERCGFFFLYFYFGDKSDRKRCGFLRQSFSVLQSHCGTHNVGIL